MGWNKNIILLSRLHATKNLKRLLEAGFELWRRKSTANWSGSFELQIQIINGNPRNIFNFEIVLIDLWIDHTFNAESWTNSFILCSRRHLSHFLTPAPADTSSRFSASVFYFFQICINVSQALYYSHEVVLFFSQDLWQRNKCLYYMTTTDHIQ